MARRTCDCGECEKCRHRAYMAEWYRRPGHAERMRGWAARYRDANLEQVREYDRSRGHRTPEYRQKVYNIVKRALNSGELVRQPCELCGDQKSHAHHDDYDQPLEVRWLCAVHHGEAHRVVNA